MKAGYWFTLNLQYRERSDRMARSILRLNPDDWFVECAIRSLRSRYCTVGALLFVQSPSKYKMNLYRKLKGIVLNNSLLLRLQGWDSAIS